MKGYRRILVPVDGSELSDLAFERALGFARLVSGNVTIVNVIQDIVGPAGPASVPVQIDQSQIAEDLLKDHLHKVEKSDIEVDSKIRHGNPADEIVDLSRDHDIIIMGSKGHNPITSLLLGSVAEKVVREACCPVMIIRKKDHECHSGR
jgi:nucleotide-binding universal stress UspA family protein